MEITPNTPKIGMQLGITPSEIKEENYSLLVNGNIQTTNGDFVLLTNEISNILCSQFKDGYKVIGVLPAISLNLTFFFLTNPFTNDSEIGYIENTYRKDTSDEELECFNCNKPLKPDIPLEEKQQLPSCNYITFVNAQCLNFSINKPIRAWVKQDDCNTRIYFTDDFNPIRYIDYPDYPKEEIQNCPKLESNFLDCSKIKVFKDSCSPNITYIDVVAGGNNTAGTLQFGITYADAYGNPITNYFYFPNKIDIWDKTKTITVNTNYPVSKSVKLQIDGINPNFDWFNLIVIKTINNVSTAFLVDTFSNTGSTFEYTYTGTTKQDLNFDTLLSRRPIYNKGRIITNANGINIIGGLEEPRILNLQPYINNLTVLWETVELNEGDYQNPIFANKYQSFLRDEVYSLAIEFGFTNTNKTARFHIPGRTPSAFDLEDVTFLNGSPNPDVFSSSACDTPSSYNPRWTVYNTAQRIDFACGADDPICDNILTATVNCQQPTFFQTPSGAYYLDYNPNTNTYSNPVADPCVYFNCDTPSAGCFEQMNEDYPNNTIINTLCEIITITPSTTDLVPVYSPSGAIGAVPAYPTLPANPLNTWCEGAIFSEIANCTTPLLVKMIDDGAETQTLWYSFVATQSAQAITITSVYNQSDSNTFTIDLYESSNNFCDTATLSQTLSQSYPYFLFQGLTIGATYFFTVKGDVNVNAGTNDFYYICTNAPEPIYYTTITRPSIVAVNCIYTLEYCVKVENCNAKVYEYGYMGYYESTERYPCNVEVWGNLANQPIRHHKMPDCKVSPHYKNLNTGSLGGEDLYNVKNKIYPLGLRIDVEQIKSLLLQAELDGKITEEERLSICSYRILRGNRRGNESIISKGLLYDIWQYEDNIYKTKKPVLYANYPYNSKQVDIFNLQSKLEQIFSPIKPIEHPYINEGYKNNKYTFYGANTLFNNPSLGSEIRLEMEQFGISEGRYSEVINHPKYQYLGIGAVKAAYGYASLEATFDAISKINEGGVASAAIISPFSSVIWGMSVPNHFYDWLDIIRKLAPFKNFAWYHTSVGRYTDYTFNPIVEGNIRRFLNDAQYIKDGYFTVNDGVDRVKLNNYKRESCVYVNTTDFFSSTTTLDNSRWYPADGSIDTGNCGNPNLGYVYRPISSYYASLKNNIPNQYGAIDQIQYIDTGYYGTIDWENTQNTDCDPIFGGDTFINRFSVRRQFPFFIQDNVGKQANTDVLYNELSNVGYPQFFFNYPTGNSLTNNVANVDIARLFGDIAVVNNVRYDFRFSCPQRDGLVWLLGATGALGVANGFMSANVVAAQGAIITNGIVFGSFDFNNPQVYLGGKFFLYSYGEPSFITESDYNIDLRYGTNQREGNFYPNISDMVDWTQPTAQFNIINYDNTYSYNNDYSKQNTENLGYLLNPNFEQDKEDCKIQHENRVIYSIYDNDNNDRFDGNLVFLANNFYDFPKTGGKLTIIKSLDNNKVLVLQENIGTVFNAYNTLEADIKAVAVGSGQLFSQQLQQLITTDLGFGGSQTSAITSTPFGTFWVDNKRAQILAYQGSINNIIPEENNQWFKENLPFKITNYFPVDIDNPYNGVGMLIWWDERFKRVFFTKKDYKPIYKEITYQDNKFYLNEEEISLKDKRYFCDQSFTIAYSPLFKNFISFYTFIPDYVNSLPNYFQTGVNFSQNFDNIGIWNHLLTNQSYTVFYGEKHPFIVEYTTKSPFTNSILNSISYLTEYRRYTDDNLNYSINNDLTYSNAIIYNQNQSTGNLKLVPKQKNNLFQFTQYPKISSNQTEILVENVNNIWSFNNFNDISTQNNQPLMVYNCNPAYRVSNPKALNYNPVFLSNKLRNDYFSIRLEDNVTSNYQILHRFSLTNKTKI